MAAAQHLQPEFTLEERIFMVVTIGSTWSQAETIRLFIAHFPNSHLPSRHTITYNYGEVCKKYEKFVNRNAGNSGRPRTARSPAELNFKILLFCTYGCKNCSQFYQRYLRDMRNYFIYKII